MSVDNLVYSTERTDNIPMVFSKRDNAPERGEVFTAKVIFEKGKKDLTIDRIKNYTGYIRKNLRDSIDAEEGKCYRFKIVAGPYTKNFHNFFYVIPLREIKNGESKGLNKLGPQDYILIQRLGEFLCGLGWSRKTKKHYNLNNNQKNWDWFYKNFM